MKWNCYNPDNGHYIESVICDIQPENSTNIEILIPVEFAKFTGTEWVDNRTPEELNKTIVPETISRMELKLQLLEFGIEIEQIIETINSIPAYMFPEIEKKKAIIKFNEATYFDRYNADLNLVATLLGLSQEQLDTMFINGKSS